MKTTNKLATIGIMGCGWLGKPSAKALLRKNYMVKGTTTSKNKLESLKDEGIEPFLIELEPEHTLGNLNLFLKNLDVLIITIPPQIKKDQNLLLSPLDKFFVKNDLSTIKKLIYISSTGVFSDGVGKVYDENSEPNNESFRGKSLIDLENVIKNQNSIEELSILRYGGLIEHGGRHPVHYLSGREGVKNPEAPVNLIELKDAVNLLIKVVESNDNLDVYHGVNPDHTNRKNYYLNKAKELNLEPPVFENAKESLGKLIKSHLTCKHLDFRFKSGI